MTVHADYMKAYRLHQRDGLVSLRHSYISAEPLLARLEMIPKRRSKKLDKALWRARRSGTFTIAQADELCVTELKLHPAEVYGEAWWAAS